MKPKVALNVTYVLIQGANFMEKLTFSKVIKSNGRGEEKFEYEKIPNSIFLAAQKVGGHNRKLAQELGLKVLSYLKNKYPEKEV